MSETREFEVTVEDIRGATKCCTDCPVHRALARVFPNAKQVEPVFTLAIIDGEIWYMDSGTRQWINNFVNGWGTPTPFKGTVSRSTAV